jgi:hypothetical protein
MTRFKATSSGLIPFSVEEELECDAIKLRSEAEAPANMRQRRNTLLVSSDWTQVIDAPVDQAAWATYRQALRDIPAQNGFPLTIEWPTSP